MRSWPQLLARGGYDVETLTEEQLPMRKPATGGRRTRGGTRAIRRTCASNCRRSGARRRAARIAVGDDVYVAGLRSGNIFVMIQPPRGFGENPLAVYHSGELVPTHHYLGAYRWMRDVFRADAIVQLGKHGTLEWLPGKGVGLSEACYPQLALGDVPLFYPFIIDDPGEGTQAKRRAHACIIDHLIPPMTQAKRTMNSQNCNVCSANMPQPSASTRINCRSSRERSGRAWSLQTSSAISASKRCPGEDDVRRVSPTRRRVSLRTRRHADSRRVARLRRSARRDRALSI